MIKYLIIIGLCILLVGCNCKCYNPIIKPPNPCKYMGINDYCAESFYKKVELENGSSCSRLTIIKSYIDNESNKEEETYQYITKCK